MFDFNKLGELAKMASQAKDIQARQEKIHGRKIELLEKISRQLERITQLLEGRALQK